MNHERAIIELEYRQKQNRKKLFVLAKLWPGSCFWLGANFQPNHWSIPGPLFAEQVLSALFILLADGQLYTATVADFSGTDPMIYRKTLRTERSDLKHLNGERLLMIFSARAPTMFIHELLSFLSLSFLLFQLQTLWIRSHTKTTYFSSSGRPPWNTSTAARWVDCICNADRTVAIGPNKFQPVWSASLFSEVLPATELKYTQCWDGDAHQFRLKSDFSPFAGGIFQSGPRLQTRQGRTTSVWRQMDVVPQVSSQLLRPRGLPLLLWWNP